MNLIRPHNVVGEVYSYAFLYVESGGVGVNRVALRHCSRDNANPAIIGKFRRRDDVIIGWTSRR